MNNNLRDSILDMLSTKDHDMKRRRVINASPSVNKNDYTTRSELEAAVSESKILSIAKKLFSSSLNIVTRIIAPPFDATDALSITKADQITPLITFDTITPKIFLQVLTRAVSGFIVGLLYPNADSTTAIKITKADGTTDVIVIDTTNKRVTIPAVITSNSSFQVGSLEFQSHSSNEAWITDNMYYNGTNWIYRADGYGAVLHFSAGGIKLQTFASSTAGSTGTAINAITITATGDPVIGISGGNVGFFGAAVAAKQTLNSYTSDGEGSAYTGISTGLVGLVYASVADLNQLRVAYETLRASYDDLRTKLQTTTLVG
jgi:hypothetical protein